MTPEQIKAFRDEFASIVYWQGQIKSQAHTIGRLESWDKGGTHDKAIERAVNTLKEYKSQIKAKLKNKSYDEWRQFSKNLSVMNNKLNRAVNDTTKAKWRLEIEKLNW